MKVENFACPRLNLYYKTKGLGVAVFYLDKEDESILRFRNKIGTPCAVSCDEFLPKDGCKLDTLGRSVYNDNHRVTLIKCMYSEVKCFTL